jgi:ubiquinone/menaquinone biosynthesis C-methylase UbiE
MPTFEEIYAQHADQYDALVSREDYEGHLLPTLNSIHSLKGADVIEFGAGTGRLTCLLAPVVRHVEAYDASAHMLTVAEAQLRALGVSNWRLAVADNRVLPAETASADVAIEGWSFGHFPAWYPETWRDEIRKALAEMQRVLRPGGTAILIETMTTGSESPRPPTPALAEYYARLEGEQGFSAVAIRTDYRFASLDEAETLTRFFFGDALADRVRRENLVILPECTGIWWRKY